MIDAGDKASALDALENLLSLGPSNIEALTLKAKLFAQEGRLDDARSVWEKVAEIDPQNEDVIEYFQNLYLEERERFYFTDELPSGGRRFLAHPKALLYAAMFGLLGCTAFLILGGLTQSYKFMTSPYITISAFVILVVFPWLHILFVYIRSPREVLITPDGIYVTTRLKCYHIQWSELRCIHIAHDSSHYQDSLSVIFMPKDDKTSMIEIDFSADTSIIKARSYFIKELFVWFNDISYTEKDNIEYSHKAIISV